MCLFDVTIDTWSIPLVINSYLDLKTYSITCMNCSNGIVQQKLNQTCESGKRLKRYGWVWMGFALRDMQHVCMALNHSSQNFTCFNGWCVLVLGHASKLVLNHPLKFDMFWWVIGFDFQVSSEKFKGTMLWGGQNRC